jgi:hypothetical protein
MTEHATHRMHAHSVEAFQSLDLAKREALVLSAYLLAGAMTDRDCARRLGFTELNSVRPQVTRLCDAGWLWEASSTKCEVTGKTVRICAPTKKARDAR